MATKKLNLRWAHLAIFCLAFIHASGAGLPLPSIIKPCSKNDPKLNECATASAMSAVPKIKNGVAGYGIPVLDPLHVKKINIDKNSLGVNLDFMNVTLHGLGKTKVKGIKITLNPAVFRWKLYAPDVKILGNYEASGRILVLPITGNGNFNFTLYGLDYTYEIVCDTAKKSDGEIYYVPKTNRIEYEVDRASLHMENLFNGNKLLGDEMNRFMNENWREIERTIGPKIAESIATAMQVIVKSLTSKVPVREIFPDRV